MTPPWTSHRSNRPRSATSTRGPRGPGSGSLMPGRWGVSALARTSPARRRGGPGAARAAVAHRVTRHRHRFDEAIPLGIAGLESAQRDSQAWAVHLWEQWARSPALPARRVLGRDCGARRHASTRGSTAELWLGRCRCDQRARRLSSTGGRPGHWSWMCRVRGCGPGERNSGAQAPRGVDSGAAGRGVRRPGSRPADPG